MVKATLRTSRPGAPAIPIQAEVVSEPVVESKTTVAGKDLTDIIPTAEVIAQAEHPEGAPTPAAAAPAPQVAVARRAEVSVPAVTSAYGPDEDGFDETDNRHPTLRIVAGSGKLSTMFNVGSLILGMTIDEAEALFGPPDPKTKTGGVLRFVPLALRKAWRENLSQEETAEGTSPRIFKTREEVEAVGGTTQWIGREAPSFKPTATCIMLIEKPEGVDSALFGTELDGKFYCPAVFYASNSAFKTFAQTLHNNARTTLLVPVMEDDGVTPKKDPRGFVVKRRYYPKYTWTFQVKQTIKKKDDRDFTVFVPEIRVLAREETGPELRAFVESLVPSSSPAEVTADE